MSGTPEVQQQISPEFYLRSGIQTYFCEKVPLDVSKSDMVLCWAKKGRII